MNIYRIKELTSKQDLEKPAYPFIFSRIVFTNVCLKCQADAADPEHKK